MRIAERNIEIVPRRNPKDGPNTRAERISTNHIGSIPTAPVPIGRSAAISAESTASSAIDLLSNSLLLTLIIRSKSAQGAASKKIHCGWPCFSLMRNGQIKPSALIALVASSATSDAPLKVKIPAVFTRHLPKLAQHRSQSTTA